MANVNPRNAIEKFAQDDGRDWMALRTPTYHELLARLHPCEGCGMKVYEGIVCSTCREWAW